MPATPRLPIGRGQCSEARVQFIRNKGDDDATGTDCRDTDATSRLRPCLRTSWRDGEPDTCYRRDFATGHDAEFADVPGGNTHGCHRTRITRFKSGAYRHIRDDGQRHDVRDIGKFLGRLIVRNVRRWLDL
jgi:hypothetical protein